MPHWLPGVLSGIFLFSFIFYAFRQGFQVKPGPGHSPINKGSMIDALGNFWKKPL
jgi:hypothetical protein